MLASIPLAYVNTTLALLFWLVLSPLGHLLRRIAPIDAPAG